MQVIETERLTLRWLTEGDAPFICELLNDPGWRRFISDKGPRSLEDARLYIVNGPLVMYREAGFGLYLTVRRSDHRPIGLCGLIKRKTLADVDLGFAFAPEFLGQGYAYEAASATLKLGWDKFALQRIVAITAPDNAACIKLLTRIGMQFEKMAKLAEDDIELKFFAHERV